MVDTTVVQNDSQFDQSEESELSSDISSDEDDGDPSKNTQHHQSRSDRLEDMLKGSVSATAKQKKQKAIER